jgi:hypothetical protein
MRRVAYGALVTTLLSVTGLSARAPLSQGPPAAGDVGVLFDDHDVLSLTIEAPFKSLLKDRDQESPYRPATMTYEEADGSTATLGLEIKTRGNFRLQRKTCNFPPLRLNFEAEAVAGTRFAGQDKLKLVTHCQDGRSEYEQYVLQEYLIYRAFTELTDLSFRVRLAQIAYVDAEQDRDTMTRYAFLIEDEDQLAIRNGWTLLELPMVLPNDLDQTQLSLVEVFQYFVGNTDFSMFRIHNAKLIGDMAGPVFPIPYDFDFSGVISARYAKPDVSLPIRNVRQRLYRGICRPQEELDAAIRTFNEKKDAIYELYRSQPALEEKFLERSLEYYDKFYETASDPGKVRRDLVRNCREA